MPRSGCVRDAAGKRKVDAADLPADGTEVALKAELEDSVDDIIERC